MCAGTDGLQSAAPGQKSLEAYPTELCRANPFPAKKAEDTAVFDAERLQIAENGRFS